MVHVKTALVGAGLAILALATIAAPAAAEAKSFNITGIGQDGEFYFEVEGLAGKNPTIALSAGDEVTITYTTESNVHNLHIGEPVNKQTQILGAEKSETVTFTVPSTVSKIEYWCDPHKVSNNMMGIMTIAGGTPPPTSNEESKSTPGFGAPLVALALAGAVLLLRRK